MPSILISHGPLFGARFPLLADNTVGRFAAATIQIPSALISRLHLRIFESSGQWFVEDLGSRNGSHLNGQKLKGVRKLAPDDAIRVGDSTFIFEASAALLASRFGDHFIVLGAGSERGEYLRGPVGCFDGLPDELAALSHLFSVTSEEAGIARGCLQLLSDRFSAFEVVLMRLSIGKPLPLPLDALTSGRLISLDGELLRLAREEGRVISVAQTRHRALKDGVFVSGVGGPSMVAALKVGQTMTGLMCVSRRKNEAPFNRQERTRLGAIAGFVAPALENARRAGIQRQRLKVWVDPSLDPALFSGGKGELLREIRTAAVGNKTILLQGPSGVGKESIGRLLHAWGHRWEGPLVSVNCALMGDAQLELELFGQVPIGRGVVGKAALAEGGCLYLDRVDTLNGANQDRLLRLLQSGHVWRMGADSPKQVDVRVIASSEVPLQSLVAEGSLRLELAYLLNVHIIEVPALKFRLDDLEDLVAVLMARIARRLGRQVHGISSGALALLRQWPWPGNLRELENVLTRAVSFSPGGVINKEDIELGAHLFSEN